MSTFLHRNGVRKSIAAKILHPSLPRSLKTNYKRAADEISGIQLGQFSTPGPKHADGKNEDRAVCGTFNDSDGTILTAYAAVLDGHGGPQCSDYISKVLATHLREQFKEEDDWAEAADTMKHAFHEIDQEFTLLARALKNNSGACATIVAIRKNELVIGHIGDCMAMIVPVSERGVYLEPYVVTHPHRADGIAEERRIIEAGGQVKNGRVLCLQPSRSFGDLDCKIKEFEGQVIAEPDVDTCSVVDNVKERPFLVVASDGVWDVLDPKAVAALGKMALKKSDYDTQLCAQKVVEAAQDKGSDDDVTCVVLVW